MTKSRHLRLSTIVVALVLLVLAAPPAGAAENGDWSVDPGGGDGPGARSHFAYTLKADQVFRDTVTVANVSDVPLTLDLYATDAYNTPLDAGFALLEDTDEPVGVGTWIDLATDQITLEPRTQAEIPFRISIPLDASPGDHAGAIVAQNVETEAEIDAEGVGIEVRRRVGARVYVRVDGPLQPDLQVTRVEVDHTTSLLPPLIGKGEAVIGYEIKNTGNTRIVPTVSVEVEGFLGGTKIAFDERELKELLPGSTVVVSEGFEGLPGLNRLTAKVNVSGQGPGGEGVDATGSSTFWVVSPLSLAAVALMPVLFLLWRRERRRPDEPVPERPAPPPAPQRELVGV